MSGRGTGCAPAAGPGEREGWLPVHGKRNTAMVLVAVGVLLIATSVIAAAAGASSVGMADVVRYLVGMPVEPKAATILASVRLPRIAAALISGCALAAAGFIIQTVLDNPMASPNVIGINAGAGFFVLLIACLFPLRYELAPIGAFVGAALSAGFVFALSALTRASRLAVVLTGMALTAVFTAGMNAILIVNPDAYVGSARFLVGGLSGVLMKNLVVPGILVAAGLVVAFMCGKRLDIIQLGRQAAHSLGLNVTVFRLLALAVAALLAGSSVSFAGMIGFVGLIVPHVARMVFPTGATRQLALSVLLGAFFVVACDLVARTTFAPYEIPVGIVMSVLGGPFFIYLVFRHGRGGRLHD